MLFPEAVAAPGQLSCECLKVFAFLDKSRVHKRFGLLLFHIAKQLCIPCDWQVEIEFKGECNAGDHVESVLDRADTQENGSSKAPVFVHVLRKADGAGNRELSRMKTSWRIL